MKRDMSLLGYQNRRHLLFWLVSLAVVGVGCTKTHKYANRYFPTNPGPDDAITIVLDQLPAEEDATSTEELEANMVGCIRDELEDTHPTLRMVAPDELRRVAFSDLTPEEIRLSDWSWDDPLFQERIAPLGLRYLIRVTVSEWKDKPKFIPFLWAQKRHATMRADIVDLMHTRMAGSIDAAANNSTAAGIVVAGGGGMAVAFPWVQFPSTPRKHACSKLGEGIAEILTREELPQEGIWPAVADEGEEIGSRPNMVEQLPEEMEAEEFEAFSGGM